MKRGLWLSMLLLALPIVSAQEVNPVRNFMILLIEVALVIAVILIINYNILEKRKSSIISKQINRVFLALLIFFSIFIRATDKCVSGGTLMILFGVILFCLALFYHLPVKEKLNRVLLAFIAPSLIFTALHAIDGAKKGCEEVVKSFFQSPPLELTLLLLLGGFFLITVMESGVLKRWT